MVVFPLWLQQIGHLLYDSCEYQYVGLKNAIKINKLFRYGTNLKQFTILYKGPKIWNSLPVSGTRSSNLLSFKTKMQEFLQK